MISCAWQWILGWGDDLEISVQITPATDCEYSNGSRLFRTERWTWQSAGKPDDPCAEFGITTIFGGQQNSSQQPFNIGPLPNTWLQVWPKRAVSSTSSHCMQALPFKPWTSNKTYRTAAWKQCAAWEQCAAQGHEGPPRHAISLCSVGSSTVANQMRLKHHTTRCEVSLFHASRYLLGKFLYIKYH